MSRWSFISQESKEILLALYAEKFPIELRDICSQWIEDFNWIEYTESSPGLENFSQVFFHQLVKHLKSLYADPKVACSIMQTITNSLAFLQDSYAKDQTQLVRNLKFCLDQETILLQQKMIDPRTVALHNHLIFNQADENLTRNLENLKSCTRNSDGELGKLRQSQETLNSKKLDYDRLYSRWQPHIALNGQNSMPANLADLKITIDRMLAQICTHRRTLMDQYQNMCEEISKLQEEVLDNRLFNWRRQQQLAGNGAFFESSLDRLQAWCESLAELVWQNRHQIHHLEFLIGCLPLNDSILLSSLTNAKAMINNLLSSLVTSTFIIEKQPPQVLKKESKFSATVRLMAGAKLNVHMSSPKMLNVTATIISEEQAKTLLRDRTMSRKETSGDILNNNGPMEFNPATRQLSISFRNMALKKIRRADKKGSETVTEEKFSILFQSEFSVGGGELIFHVWTLSLPVVVTVHGNQECNALATILWDNAFAKPRRDPFEVPEKVPWQELATTLNTKFLANCGRGLTESNITYLAYKLMGQMEDYSLQYVSWSQFNREPLVGRGFTFWEWFYQILKLTKDWLLLPWQEGLLQGFVDKKAAEEQLMGKQNGTFLFRFSDSEIGGISVAWVHEENGEKKVSHLEPFTKKKKVPTATLR